MTDDRETEMDHRRPHTPPIALPFLEYDLVRELRQLREESSWKNGQNAKTLDLLPGSFLALDKAVPHDLEALEDSAFVLTMAWPGSEKNPVEKR